MTLTKAFSYAERMELVETNPIKLVSTPMATMADPTLKVWTLGQMRRFLAASIDDGFYPLWHLAVWIGMRRGELLGLKWRNVDLPRRILAVRRTKTTTATGTVEVQPKTSRGVRTVELDTDTVQVLKQYRAGQAEDRLTAGSAWHETGLVLSARRQGALLPMSLASLQDSRRKDWNPNYLASWIAALSRDCPTCGQHSSQDLQERLGQQFNRVTMEVYSSVLLSMQKQAVQRLAEEAG